MEMNYCMHCGTKLIMKECKGEEGLIPFCPECGQYRFPVFNTAVSMVVRRESDGKIVLIKQYGRDFYILVAGYVNKGEDAEEAVRREILEELGMHAVRVNFNRSHYFAPSNTLMLNFTAWVKEDASMPNEEIDSYSWFTPSEARANIKPGSLAEEFLTYYLDREGL